MQDENGLANKWLDRWIENSFEAFKEIKDCTDALELRDRERESELNSLKFHVKLIWSIIAGAFPIMIALIIFLAFKKPV
jgi:hypothetical protein